MVGDVAGRLFVITCQVHISSPMSASKILHNSSAPKVQRSPNSFLKSSLGMSTLRQVLTSDTRDVSSIAQKHTVNKAGRVGWIAAGDYISPEGVSVVLGSASSTRDKSSAQSVPNSKVLHLEQRGSASIWLLDSFYWGYGRPSDFQK